MKIAFNKTQKVHAIEMELLNTNEDEDSLHLIQTKKQDTDIKRYDEIFLFVRRLVQRGEKR